MDENPKDKERTTRSGRNISGGTSKRKRHEVDDPELVKSSAKRKMGNTDEMSVAEQIAELKVFFGNKLDKGLQENREKIAEDNKGTFNKITKRMDKTDAGLAAHKASTQDELNLIHQSIDALSAKWDDKRECNPNNGPNYASAAATTSTSRFSSRPNDNDKHYWRSRRCARLSPVMGETDRELWSNTQQFFSDKMRIPTTELREDEIVSIRRVLVPRGRKSKFEVCVLFIDAETRDRIASYARNLGDFVENGKPTATFRHEIPTYLVGVHKALMQYGFAMSKKHGGGFKRNVRFDDTIHSFCIDVCLPGHGQKWHTITYEQALQECQDRAMEAAKTRGNEIFIARTPWLQAWRTPSQRRRARNYQEHQQNQ